MGGSVGGAVKNTFSNPIRGLTAIGTFGTSELARKMGPIPKQLAGLPESVANAILGTHYGQTGTPDIGGNGPFQLDRGQLDADQAAIAALGASQDAQNQDYISKDATSRSTARDALAQALTNQGQASFQQSLPQTEELLNSQHLLNGSGLGQELARQQGYLATNIANQVGVQGAQDMNRTSDLKQGALQSLQGFGQAGLGRQLSLEDFINQANVAKTIGAQAAPQVGNGKGQTGTLLSGIGSLAPLAGAMMGGPAGAAVGSGAKYVMSGPNAGQKYGK